MNSAALSSESRIIAVIRMVSYALGVVPCRARVASRSAASQAFTVDSMNVVCAARRSPTLLFVRRSSRVNEAQSLIPSVTAFALRPARASATGPVVGTGFGVGLGSGDGVATGEGDGVVDGSAGGSVDGAGVVAVGLGSAAGAASGTVAGSALAPPGVPAATSPTIAVNPTSTITVR